MVVPVGWVIKELGSEIEFQNGTAHENIIKEYGKYIVANSKFISTEGKIKKFSDVCITPCHKNDILMVMSDVPNGRAIGKCFFVDIDDKYTLNQRICRMKSYYNNDKLLYYILDRNQYFLSFDDGAKQTNLRREDILKCSIMLPKDKEEQNAIAEALSDIDNLITSLQKLIDKKKSIKQGAMQELLTGKKRLPGFKKEWIHKALGEVAIIKDGTHGTFERKKDGVLLLSAKNVFNGHLILDNESFISREDYLKIVENGFPTKGDILLSCVGTIGRCCIYTGKPKAAFQRSVAFIRTSKMCNTFLLYLLQEEVVQSKLRQSANASAQGGVYLGTLIDIDLYYPSDLKEQQAIAQVFMEMDNEIEQLEKKLDKYQQIKQGMMQELLTGHIRLIDDGEKT